jgi:nucleoside-diphosphate-sugar epimerase
MGADIPVVEVPTAARPTEMWRSYCDNLEARELLGWKPSIHLTEGLRRTIDYLLTNRS